MWNPALGRNRSVIGLGTWPYRGSILRSLQRTEDIVRDTIREILNIFLRQKVSPWHTRVADGIRTVDASLKWLKTDYVDLDAAHWPNQAVLIEETIVAVEKQLDRRKVGFIGVSDLRNACKSTTKAQIRLCSLIDRTVKLGLLEFHLRMRKKPQGLVSRAIEREHHVGRL